MEFKSLFGKIFGGEKDYAEKGGVTSFRMLNTYENVFAEGHSMYFDDLTVRTCVDCIARHASKLKPTHIRKRKDIVEPDDSRLNDIISRRPNALMSTADFLYRLAYKVWLYGNAFAYVKRVNGAVRGVYLLDYASLELKEIDDEVYCKFQFGSGEKMTVPYSDVIHVRRYFGQNEMLGGSPQVALQSQLQLLHTCKQSLASIVKNSTAMRGYLKYDTPIKDKDKEKAVQQFNQIAQNNGIGVLDADVSYQDLSKEPQATNKAQMDFVREDIYRYFGLSEAIVNGSYTEEQWQAFFESVIEPFAIQLGLEFTEKIFTERERGFGNEIIFDQNRLQYASTANKVDMIYKLLPQGVITINQACEIMNMPPCDDPAIGNKRFMTLNNDTAESIGGLKGGEEDGESEN